MGAGRKTGGRKAEDKVGAGQRTGRTPGRGQMGAGWRTRRARADDRVDAGQRTGGRWAQDKVGAGRRTGRTPDRGRVGVGRRTGRHRAEDWGEARGRAGSGQRTDGTQLITIKEKRHPPCIKMKGKLKKNIVILCSPNPNQRSELRTRPHQKVKKEKKKPDKK